MEQKLVSVIMPIYNVEDYLENSIESILNQKYTRFELILVDDGSKDKSPAIIDKFARIDDRVVVVHQANAGAAAARNKGINMAKGEYISFIDSDDLIEPEYLDKMVQGLESCSAELVVCKFEPFGVENPPKVKDIEAGVVNRDMAIAHCLGYNCFNGYVWNKLFCVSLLKNNSIYFEDGYFPNEDVLFVAKYIYHCSTVVILSDVLYHYRQNNTGGNRGRYSGNKEFDKKCLNSLKATASIAEYYKEQKVTDACKLHDIREAGIVLRSMAAGKYTGKEYRELVSFVRKNAWLFFKSNEASFSQKMSVILTVISPSLELMAWRKMNKT